MGNEFPFTSKSPSPRATLLLKCRLKSLLVVPIAVIELNEAHAPLGQPPLQQAVRPKRAVAGRASVRLKTLRRFLAGVHQIRNAGLPVKRQLVLRDAGRDF